MNATAARLLKNEAKKKQAEELRNLNKELIQQIYADIESEATLGHSFVRYSSSAITDDIQKILTYDGFEVKSYKEETYIHF